MEHTLQHPIGLMHLTTAMLAIAVGLQIVLSRKGTPRHRWLGRFYVALMFMVNVTAFLIYELFGTFGLFHWMALASLLTVVIGYLPALSRKPGWRTQHAFFMAGSYVGLIAAFAAETLTRWIPLPFFAGVGIISFSVILVGVWMMRRFIPRILQ